MRTPVLTLLFSLTTAVHSAAGTGCDATLERAREAARRTAWSALEHGLRLEGRTLMTGVDAGFVLHFAADGAYRFETDGPLALVATGDVQGGWDRERRGPARPSSAAERADALILQWVHSGFWVDAAAPLAIERVATDGDAPVYDLSIPAARSSSRLTLDAETLLPALLESERSGYPITTRFEDYRPVAGVPIAHRVSTEQAGTAGDVRVSAGSAATEPEPARYSLGGIAAEDVRFDPERPATIAVRRVDSGHLLVRPTVDGAERGWFILDTGAGQLCIDPTVADALELPELGAVPAMGTAGVVTASFRQGGSFELGPVAIEDPLYVELDLAFLAPYFGVEVAGICGYDLFARAVVELDLVGPTASIHDPSRYALEGGAWTPLVLDNRLPCIECRFEGDREGMFRIDTGDAGNVTFHSPAVERLALLEGRETRSAIVGGVGGSAAARTGELDWFEVGGVRRAAVEATFTVGEVGVHADPQLTGTLGSGLLRPFKIVFDYPHGRIALVPHPE